MPRPEGKKFFRQRERSEYDQRTLDIRRVSRTVKGGRRFSFRATIVMGNKNGKVAVGVGKGADVALAIEKATADAKRRMIQVPVTKTGSIAYDVTASFASAKVLLRPAREGRGLVAGGPVRAVAALAGIQNLTAKILSRSPNKLNNARATIEALRQLKK
ncbi:MAG: 30S ribosomal protein S5 [Candidatus Sungbacteria bacterium RIFCSPLOWO2_02_FULL_48_13b]|uniref:Small ribosomal subunit protein uS5 n=2 Tax=Candidatus Sungiibacteriota TaxID=1817917 RepID=A0A1G2LDZ0_9BACT|nr:MAG: 30S ribosomal protein S5 [Candidatus Sungbacteria bacterium RIFCSPHIGHO2_02_FULL_49_20]OHA09848.1 MAG: 30S ribosomal protein S5 [Candidatus Sungbacteria bacterium RIFCSPLOWO2_02_FULL_48_13b]